MGAKARLERDLIIAQQQRDRAYRARDAAVADAADARAELRRLQSKPTLAAKVRNWLDEMASALGIGF